MNIWYNSGYFFLNKLIDTIDYFDILSIFNKYFHGFSSAHE